jgi:hypothetical protein
MKGFNMKEWNKTVTVILKEKAAARYDEHRNPIKALEFPSGSPEGQ